MELEARGEGPLKIGTSSSSARVLLKSICLPSKSEIQWIPSKAIQDITMQVPRTPTSWLLPSSDLSGPRCTCSPCRLGRSWKLRAANLRRPWKLREDLDPSVRLDGVKELRVPGFHVHLSVHSWTGDLIGPSISRMSTEQLPRFKFCRLSASELVSTAPVCFRLRKLCLQCLVSTMYTKMLF